MTRRRRDIRVLVVDDHRVFAQALCEGLAAQGGYDAAAATDRDEALRAVRSRPPDVVLMDVVLPGEGGVETARRIKEHDPRIAVVMLSAYEDDLVKARSLTAGADGYLAKTVSLETLMDSIGRAARGEPVMEREEVDRILGHGRRKRWEDPTELERADRLSPREQEILQLMADGLRSIEIADRLGISRNTLRTHLQNVLTKLGVHTKTQALLVAIRYGKVSAGARRVP